MLNPQRVLPNQKALAFADKGSNGAKVIGQGFPPTDDPFIRHDLDEQIDARLNDFYPLNPHLPCPLHIFGNNWRTMPTFCRISASLTMPMVTAVTTPVPKVKRMAFSGSCVNSPCPTTFIP